MSKKIKNIKKILKAVKPLKAKTIAKKAKKEKGVKAKPVNEKKVKKKSVVKVAKKKTVKAEKKVIVKKKNQVAKPIQKIKEKKEKVLKTPKEEKVKKISKSSIFKIEKKGSDDFNEKKQKPRRRKGGRKRKNKGDDDEPEIIHDELLEQLIRSTRRLKAPPKKPRILKTFVNPISSLTVALPVDGSKSATPKKEPKGKFVLEYLVHTSVGILYEFLTTPSGLSEWFADDVNIQDGIFTFMWEGSAQKAKLVGFKDEEYIRLQWLDKPEGTYFEFRIQHDEVTSDISLIITDFADEAADLETSKRLWDSQINNLLHVIGSY